MKRTCVLLLLLVLLSPVINLAQTRRRSTSTRRARPAPAASGVAETRAGAERVAEQLKNLTRFIYLYGRISNGLETTDQLQAQQGRRGDPGSAQLERVRTGLRDGIRNVRAGLDDLEVYFSSTPAVRRYYALVVGVAAGAEAAERQVAAGQYDQGGRSLLNTANRLADALAAMR